MIKYRIICIANDDKDIGISFDTEQDAQNWINKKASECGGRGKDGELCDGCLSEYNITQTNE